MTSQMDFWEAYLILREQLCARVEEAAVGAEVSFHTILAWDRAAKDRSDRHGRKPSFFNRIRLARLAEAKGAPAKVVDALKPEQSTADVKAS